MRSPARPRQQTESMAIVLGRGSHESSRAGRDPLVAPTPPSIWFGPQVSAWGVGAKAFCLRVEQKAFKAPLRDLDRVRSQPSGLACYGEPADLFMVSSSCLRQRHNPMTMAATEFWATRLRFGPFLENRGRNHLASRGRSRTNVRRKPLRSVVLPPCLPVARAVSSDWRV